MFYGKLKWLKKKLVTFSIFHTNNKDMIINAFISLKKKKNPLKYFDINVKSWVGFMLHLM